MTMSGLGRGVKRKGMGGAKRNGKVFKDSIQGIIKPKTRRLARRGGVIRIPGLLYKESKLKAIPGLIYKEHQLKANQIGSSMALGEIEIKVSFEA